jgi:hypothetical protein
MRNNDFLFDTYNIKISNWDDGDWGRSILNKVRDCLLSPTGWTYEPGSDATFADGTQNDHWVSFHLVISDGECAEGKIEEAIGLRAGGLNCPLDQDYEELDLMA